MSRAPIRVAYWYDGTLYGGIERALVTFFSHLDRAQVEPLLVWAGPRNDARFAQELRAAKVETAEITPPDLSRLDRAQRMLSTLKLLREKKPRVIHIHSSGVFSQAAIAGLARAAGIPVVRTIHVPFGRWKSNAAKTRNPARAAFHRWIERGLAAAITVSEADRRELVASGAVPAARCVTIANGIPLEPFRALPERRAAKQALGFDPDALLVGGVGRLTYQKQFDQLVEAMPHLIARAPGVNAAIAGDGDDFKKLQSRIAALGLGERVRLLGERDDVPACIAAFDLLVIPSLFESQGLVFAEAMAAGAAIVASRLDCFEEMEGGAGAARFAETGNPERFAAAIAELLESPAAREAMGAAGRARAQLYSAESHVAKIVALYQQALGHPPPGPHAA